MNIDAVLQEVLTPEQRAAATAPEREVLALACAGSGKSRTLAYRIAWLIVNGAEPAGIVAFTFTDKAAESIKVRVAEALGTVGGDPALVGAMYTGTIHAWCRMILGSIDARYRQYEVLDGNRMLMYLMSRYPRLGAEELKRLREAHQRGQYRAGYFATLKAVRDAWNLLNDEVLTVDDVRAEDPDLATVLSNLGTQLDADHFIDFSSMIRRVVDLLAAGDAGAEQALAPLEHLLVDEYQDVNPVQERLIRLMHERSESLIVVGDDDQAIYSWRGADVDNILTFSDRHPAAAAHELAQNFRSTPEIVSAADEFVQAELGPSRMPKTPTAKPCTEPSEIGTLRFPSRADEAEWVADRIASLLGTRYIEDPGDEHCARGLTPADFAILMRSTKTAEQDGTKRHTAFTSALAARDIPYSLDAGGGLFDRAQPSALRDAFGLLRDASPNRAAVESLFRETLLPVFPKARLRDVVRVFTDWGRRIHAPRADGAPRQRLLPQQLLHDLLAALGIAHSEFDDGVMADIGTFSRILQDAESVYVSIESADRFQQLLNFLENVAADGYEPTNQMLTRPDAVMVSTVHQAKGLEFPAVFIADVEQQRFPGRGQGYDGWLPVTAVQKALDRGAYNGDKSNKDEDARLFYTAMTRAERFLYVSGSKMLPAGKRETKVSTYTARLTGGNIRRDLLDAGAPRAVVPPSEQQRRRGDESTLPTTFSQIRYYLRCPKDYQLRVVFGFSPPIAEMFGFGQTVHAAIGKLHERYPDHAPTTADAEQLTGEVFHLKHVPPSNDPENRPGGYEMAQESAKRIVSSYAGQYGEDFRHERQVEQPFEVPIEKAVLSGAIDLLLRLDDSGEVAEASVVDFKTMEAGPDPEHNPQLSWDELALQVQLYARGATRVLGQNAKTGAVHLLKDGQRLTVPVDDEAVDAAIANIEWAVARIIAGDFPERPSPSKCDTCDFVRLCSQKLEGFSTATEPPTLHLPFDRAEMVAAFADVSVQE